MVSAVLTLMTLLAVTCILTTCQAGPVQRHIDNSDSQYENSLSEETKNLYETRLELLKLLTEMKRQLNYEEDTPTLLLDDPSHVARAARSPAKRNAGMVDMVLMMPDLFRHGRK